MDPFEICYDGTLQRLFENHQLKWIRWLLQQPIHSQPCMCAFSARALEAPMQRPGNDFEQRRAAFIQKLREKYARDMVKHLRKMDWPLRNHAFKSLRRINPRVAIEVEMRMGPDELLDVDDVSAEPDAVIPLPDLPMTCPRLFTRRVRQRLV